jgi:Putative methyltransferase
LTMDWYAWHRGYDESTALKRRLETVQRHIVDALDRAPTGPLRILSICAGDGRDLIGALRTHPRRNDATGTLVELNPRLVEQGRTLAVAANLSDRVRFDCADATRRDTYETRVPCQLALACGVIGNLAPDTTPAFIRLASAVCDTGGSLIWTRLLSANNGASHTPIVRRLLADAGFEEVRADVVDADDGDPAHLRNEFGAGRFLVASHVHRVGPTELPWGEPFKFVGYKALLEESKNR